MRFRTLMAACTLTVPACVAMAAPGYGTLLGAMYRTSGQTTGIGPNYYTVSTTTGAATLSGAINVNFCVGIACSPDGTLYGMTDQLGRINNTAGQGGKNLLFKMDPTTGAATAVGRIDPTGVNQEFEGDIAFNPVTGQLYALDTAVNQGYIFPVDRNTGQGNFAASAVKTILPVTGTDLDLSAMTFDAAGNCWVLDTRYPNHPGPAILEKIDLSTGSVLTSYTTTKMLGTCAGMAFDPVSGLLYMADGDTGGTANLYTFDFAAGDFTVVGATGAQGLPYSGNGGLPYTGLAGLTFMVPEPSVFGSIPLAALLLGRRRRA